jgi:hypothetical protein
LHLDGAPNGVDHALKLRQKAVAGVLYDPVPLFRDFRLDYIPEMGLEPLVRPLLIRAHETGVTRHVGG